MSHSVFDDIEKDMGEAAATAFARLAVEYYAATREGDGPVSTPLSPEAASGWV